MCNAILGRLLVVLAVLLLLLTRWGGAGANRKQETDTGVGVSSFGTFGCAHTLFASTLDDARWTTDATAYGDRQFVRHVSRLRGTIARRYWFGLIARETWRTAAAGSSRQRRPRCAPTQRSPNARG